MTRPLCALALALSLAVASPVAAFQLPYEAKVSVRFGAMPPLVTQLRTGVAEVDLNSGVLQTLQLSGDVATTGAYVGPLPPATFAPIAALKATFGVWFSASPLPLGTLERDAGGHIGGDMRLLGLARVCLFSAPCASAGDAFIPFAHPTAGGGPLFYDAAVGWRGTWTAMNPGPGVNFTVRGAPWTTAAVSAGNGVTGMGFAVGPESQPGTSVRNGGRLSVVTPIYIRTSIPQVPFFPAIATLEIRFTADPPGPACSNGIDDDRDGLIDFGGDPACQTADFPRENAKCQDGVDNDSDAGIDFDGGASLNGGVPLASPDPQCAGRPARDRETPDSCGLGAELMLVLPLLALTHRRWKVAMG